ncbi:UNVERIFIED_CONTAM: hypothetical protein FKN15_040554 [Acipenser sinensis]
MDRNALAELLQALESRRDAEERRREERYTALIERYANLLRFEIRNTLTSGVLVYLSLSGPQLEKVTIDRTLVGRLIGDTITDAVLTNSFIILSFLVKNRVCYIHKETKLPRRVEKLSISDLKLRPSPCWYPYLWGAKLNLFSGRLWAAGAPAAIGQSV